MPQTYAARAERWPGQDEGAISFLVRRGFVLSKDGKWQWPAPLNPKHTLTAMETDAILYLVEEWDFGGYDGPEAQCPAYSEADFRKAYEEYVEMVNQLRDWNKP